MAAQIQISEVGVPSERNTGIPLDIVSSAEPAATQVSHTNPMASTTAMTTNNMPAGRRV
jgi:hypothetical protein